MTRTVVQRRINAPVDRVFDVIAHVNNFSKAVEPIKKVEFLSDVQKGIGTRFLETRVMKGKEMTVELEVTEYVANDHVRIVSDTHGTVWDTVFKVTPQGDQTELVMTMDANAHKLLPKLVNPLIKGMIQKYLEQDMDAVKQYCEAPPPK